MRCRLHARRCFESDTTRNSLQAAMVFALVGTLMLMARSPAAHWRAVEAFVTLTVLAWVICLWLGELMGPIVPGRNKRAIAFAIILFYLDFG